MNDQILNDLNEKKTAKTNNFFDILKQTLTVNPKTRHYKIILGFKNIFFEFLQIFVNKNHRKYSFLDMGMV